MVQSREVIYLKDFSGGLNLTTQLQSLGENESPDCLDVDFGYRGGFVVRGGFQTQAYNTLLEDAYFVGASYFGNDVVLVVATDAAGSLLEWDGSSLTDTTENITDEPTKHVRMSSFVWELGGTQEAGAFLVNCYNTSALVSHRWDGSTLTTYGSLTFNDDYTTPAGGEFPAARLAASHNGYMWVADTVESTKRYPHRVRFSHVQQPEDWAEADYFDVNPDDDGDPVTALVPFKDHLLVFKVSGVYAVYGYSRDEFFYERISGVAGVSDPRAVTMNSGVCYWYTGDGTIMAYNGKGVVPLTDKLRWWSDTGKISHPGDHWLMWADGRLYLSLVAGATETVNRFLFVYDPSIKALTRYSPIVGSMFHWERVDSEHCPLFLFETDWNLYRFDRGYNVDTVVSADGAIQDSSGDELLDSGGNILLSSGSPPSEVNISGYYRTGWITAGETATKKRWKRPRITAAAEGPTTIEVEVFHDFDEDSIVKYFEVVIPGGSGSVWGTMDWGEGWDAGQDDYYRFDKMPSGGAARALQYKFTSTSNVGRWWVDSIAIPYRRRQVK